MAHWRNVLRFKRLAFAIIFLPIGKWLAMGLPAARNGAQRQTQRNATRCNNGNQGNQPQPRYQPRNRGPCGPCGPCGPRYRGCPRRPRPRRPRAARAAQRGPWRGTGQGAASQRGGRGVYRTRGWQLRYGQPVCWLAVHARRQQLRGAWHRGQRWRPWRRRCQRYGAGYRATGQRGARQGRGGARCLQGVALCWQQGAYGSAVGPTASGRVGQLPHPGNMAKRANCKRCNM